MFTLANGSGHTWLPSCTVCRVSTTSPLSSTSTSGMPWLGVFGTYQAMDFLFVRGLLVLTGENRFHSISMCRAPNFFAPVCGGRRERLADGCS